MKEFDTTEAEALMKRYPYFTAPAVSLLRTAAPEERARLMRRIAAAVCSEADLRAIAGIDPEEFASFYPDARHADPGTEATIDSFLEKFSTPEKSATPRVEEIGAAPAIDYAAMMLDEPRDERREARDGEAAADPTASLISSFLNAVPPKTPAKKRPLPKPEPAAPQKPEHSSKTEASDDALSESLARMMVKNGNYRKALEIITDLSLNNPKKSIYFADQMRFLKKLIQNQEKSGSNR